ncbi:MAG TPA: crossover junction endodeoxyribonuclease RuvC [Candidatus Deferrimicrobiaceae bacterium]|nr:crossover junction endodeoxyribonuclease RuvC [Candidatus Deferrimicrobiaceae bacterium]
MSRRILGIDPGSRRTGYGMIDVRGRDLSPVTWGVIRTDSTDSFPDRLHKVTEELNEVIRLHRPTEAVVESVFLAKNVASALKLGQVRGAVIVTCRTHGLPVHEYSAREIKQAATGFGAAPKEQVGGMVCRLLGIRKPVPIDATDALAIAFCRAVTRPSPSFPVCGGDETPGKTDR